MSDNLNQENAEEVKGQSDTPEEAESGNQDDSESGASGGVGGWLHNYLKKVLSLGDGKKTEQVLGTVDLQGIVDFIKNKKCSNIITMAGAGISTSAGIPDFRSPGSGLYDNLQKYNLPDPQAVFSIEFFKENPEPFFDLAKELLPGDFKPTPCHYFIKMLSDKGLLLRHYTQNIDSLERLSGLPEEKIVEAHGTFHTSHCLECRKEYSQEWIKGEILKGGVPKCDVTDCTGVVKPDIVFFGESLPKHFFECVQNDMGKCDLLIIMGTSLVVQPFASLMNRVPDTTPRLYINRDEPMSGDPFMALMMGGGGGFEWDKKDNYRDVFWQGDCDAASMAFADLLGWGEDLRKEIGGGEKEQQKPSPDEGAPGKDVKGSVEGDKDKKQSPGKGQKL